MRDEATTAAAERDAGGAATRYELVKTSKYAAIVPPGAVFVPFIVDTYGALGARAVEALRTLIPVYAQHAGLTNTVASRVIYGRISGTVIRGIAGIAALA